MALIVRIPNLRIAGPVLENSETKSKEAAEQRKVSRELKIVSKLICTHL